MQTAARAHPQDEQLELRLLLDNVVARQAPRARADWLVDDLQRLLTGLTQTGDVGSQARWLQGLVRWLRVRRSGLGGGSAGALSSARLRLFLEALRELPAEAAALTRLATSVLTFADGVSLFAEAGLPEEQSFVGAAWDRMLAKCLPGADESGDLAGLVAGLFPEREDADWLEELAPELAIEVACALGLDPAEARAPLQGAMLDALSLLAARVSALGLAPDVRSRTPDLALGDNPFLRLPRACDAFASAARSGSAQRLSSAASALRAAQTHCRWMLSAVHERLEDTGVSLDLIWRLERTRKTLDRMASLISVLDPESGTAVGRAGTAVQLLASLVRERLQDRSVRSLMRTSAHKLARKAIERAGRSGEHYITRSREGWHRMVSSAAGGGLLTALTVVLKFAVAGASLPLFFEGFASSLNYAGSFLLMQLFGFTLATKQPAMTAAALAAAIRPAHKDPGSIDAPGLVALIARITRSQLAAVAGNIGMVVPAAIALDGLWRLFTGHPFLSEAAAHHVVESLHPTHSGTILFGALTGGMLWVASLGAGWLENWVVFRRIPEGVAGSRRVRAVLGEARAARLAHAISHGAAGIGGSVTLGVLLGMVPVLGRFFGLAVESRHVTLSTGSLALAACATGPAHLGSAFAAAAVGIAVIALLNFGVSFALALTVALNGREASHREQRSVGRELLRQLVRDPLAFILPPRD